MEHSRHIDRPRACRRCPAYAFGAQRVAGPISLLLLSVVIGLVAAVLIFYRRYEKELIRRQRRAENEIPGSG
jgi:hypothetical protein